MSARFAAAATALLLLGSGCGSTSSILSLQQVEAAFAQNGMPFRCEWQAVGRDDAGSKPGCGPNDLMHFVVQGPCHLCSRAWRPPRRFASGGEIVRVYNTAATARQIAPLYRQENTTDDAVIVVRNVIYVGKPSAAARHAMASLRK